MTSHNKKITSDDILDQYWTDRAGLLELVLDLIEELSTKQRRKIVEQIQDFDEIEKTASDLVSSAIEYAKSHKGHQD